MDANGIWRAAPAYDLTFSYSGHGMHSTMVAGESTNPTKKHLLELGNYFKMKNANAIIDEVHNIVKNWSTYAESSGVGDESRQNIQKVISRT